MTRLCNRFPQNDIHRGTQSSNKSSIGASASKYNLKAEAMANLKMTPQLLRYQRRSIGINASNFFLSRSKSQTWSLLRLRVIWLRQIAYYHDYHLSSITLTCLLCSFLPLPKIGTYFNCIMFMVASSVVTTIMILNYHHRLADTHDMPPWVSGTDRED